MSKRDLFVVVADLDAENTIKTLLTERQEALGIALNFFPFSPPNGDLLRYSGRDSGCYGDAVDLLRPPQKTHYHAILCFDLHGSGADIKSREMVETEIENQLHINGWTEGDAVAIVINPELEAWVWADSREVAMTMGWDGDMNSLRNYLISRGLWNAGETKPPDPKTAMKQAVRAKRRRRLTAPLFAELARKVSFHSCEDPAFNKLRNTLQQWFPR
jgi:hypothetical protein